MKNIHVERLEKEYDLNIQYRKSPSKTLLLLEQDEYEVNMIKPARPSELKSFYSKKNKLPNKFRGYRHQIGRRNVTTAPTIMSNNNYNNNNMFRNEYRAKSSASCNSSSSSRPNTSSSTKRKKNTRMRKNVSDANAYNRLKREMEKQIAITTKQNDKINQLEMKVKSLQKKLLIERNENEHLKKRIHETIQTNEMADAYLRSLLQNRPK